LPTVIAAGHDEDLSLVATSRYTCDIVKNRTWSTVLYRRHVTTPSQKSGHFLIALCVSPRDINYNLILTYRMSNAPIVSRAEQEKEKSLRHTSHHISYRFYHKGKMHLGVVAGRNSAGRLALPVRLLLPVRSSGRLFLCSLQVGVRDCSKYDSSQDFLHFLF